MHKWQGMLRYRIIKWLLVAFFFELRLRPVVQIVFLLSIVVHLKAGCNSCQVLLQCTAVLGYSCVDIPYLRNLLILLMAVHCSFTSYYTGNNWHWGLKSTYLDPICLPRIHVLVLGSEGWRGFTARPGNVQGATVPPTIDNLRCLSI